MVDANGAAEAAAGAARSSSVLPVAVFFGILIIGGLAAGLFLMRRQKGAAADGHASEPSGRKGGGWQEPLDTKRLVELVEDVEDGIIVTDSGRRFVSAITCRGIDFYNESAKEQLSVMRGYQSFLNVITSPVTYRMHGKAVDMDAARERYAAKYRETLDDYEASMKELQTALDRKDGQGAAAAGAETDRLELRLRHLKEQMHVLDYYSSSDNITDLTQEYVFDWEYLPSAGEELSYAAVLARAKKELRAIAGQKIDALAAAGIKARICTNGEILDMLRSTTKPVTAQEYKQKAVDSSSYFEDIVSSGSEEQLLAAARFEDEEAIADGFDDFTEGFFEEAWDEKG